MALYAIKKDDGTLVDTYGDMVNENLERGVYFEAEPNKSKAERCARQFGGHVVELVEKPEPVVVSEAEAEMLEQAKNMLNPMHVLWMNELTHNGDSDGQNRIMRAYVNGWKVEKPKRWYVKVPGKFASGQHWFWKLSEKAVDISSMHPDEFDTDERFKFTADEIEHYGLQDCEKVEVKD